MHDDYAYLSVTFPRPDHRFLRQGRHKDEVGIRGFWGIHLTGLSDRVIHSSYYRMFSDGNSGGWIGEMLSTFPQPKMNIY